MGTGSDIAGRPSGRGGSAPAALAHRGPTSDLFTAGCASRNPHRSYSGAPCAVKEPIRATQGRSALQWTPKNAPGHVRTLADDSCSLTRALSRLRAFRHFCKTRFSGFGFSGLAGPARRPRQRPRRQPQGEDGDELQVAEPVARQVRGGRGKGRGAGPGKAAAAPRRRRGAKDTGQRGGGHGEDTEQTRGRTWGRTWGRHG